MLDIDTVPEIKVGDILIVRDFHTLSANDGDEISVEITGVNTWENEAFSMYGFEFDVSEDVQLMVLVRMIKDGDEIVATDIRMLRNWESSIQSEFEGVDLTDAVEGVFSDSFDIVHAGEEEDGELTYAVKKPFPFWDIKKDDGLTVGLVEYGAVDTEEDGIPDNYWAKHAVAEWYAHVGDNGEDGLLTLWFGWDIGIDDLDLMQG